MKLRLTLTLILSLGAGLTLSAAPRSSSSYSLPSETLHSGGRMASSNYTADTCIGEAAIAVQSVQSFNPVTTKPGYIGQLTETTNVLLNAASTTLNEGTTRQLNATAQLDDGTSLALNPHAHWSMLTGAIASINGTGLATAAMVYQDTPAVVRAAYQGKFADLGLLVLNVGLDDYGLYAADGVPDALQVQTFGINNPNGQGTADPDGDGQSNSFEYIAGTDPLDINSRFRFALQPVSGKPLQQAIVFSPRLPSRTYSLEYQTNAAAPFLPFTNGTLNDAGLVRTVTDTNAAGAMKFYRARITLP